MRVLRIRLPPLQLQARPNGESERFSLPDKRDQEQARTTH